jgi:hypothetical protein
MTGQANEVNDLIKALNDGLIGLEGVAQRFRERSWPTTRPPRPANYIEMAAQAMQDPEPGLHGSFDDVAAAYYRGELTEHQYDVLSKAVAEAKRGGSRNTQEGSTSA